MRHGNKINHLGRKTAHRKAMLKNMSNSLILHKRITTTVAKAKEFRKHIEPLLNKTKVDSTHNRRVLFSYLQDKESIKELFGVIAEKIADRPGGYTRIIKMGFRAGDAAEMAMIELVDFNDVYVKEVKTTTTRTRRGKKSTSTIESAKVVSSENSVQEDLTVEENVESNDSSLVEEVAVIEEILPIADIVENPVVEQEVSVNTFSNQDDLKVVEGIGPAIEKLLNDKNIFTFEQLSTTSAESIKEILAEAGSRFAIHDPETWPFQAQLLNEGRMEEFQKLTDELKGGKKVD